MTEICVARYLKLQLLALCNNFTPKCIILIFLLLAIVCYILFLGLFLHNNKIIYPYTKMKSLFEVFNYFLIFIHSILY